MFGWNWQSIFKYWFLVNIIDITHNKGGLNSGLIMYRIKRKTCVEKIRKKSYAIINKLLF